MIDVMQGIRILEEAQTILHAHLTHALGLQAVPEEEARPRMRQAIKGRWADEYADLLQGLALARVIFNQSRDEDLLIERLFTEAIELRNEAGNRSKLADTTHALGSLKQKPAAGH